VILFVGGLEPEKGLVELVAAWRGLGLDGAASGPKPRAPHGALPTASPVHLVLVGEGSLQGLLSAEAASPGSGAARLILAGPRTLDEVAQHLGACDLLALPSWHEGTPNVVLEALASGRPVVGTRVGGIPDAVPEGRAGLLVPPHDVPALTAALATALSRSWDEAALVAAAPPSWEESAARLHWYLEAAAG
jgi:glycosyltransferase involved in cell wall biosynthesis